MITMAILVVFIYGAIIVAELFANMRGELCSCIQICVRDLNCKCVKESLNAH